VIRRPALLTIFLLCASFPAIAAESAKPVKPIASAAILPNTFGGWQLQGTAQISQDPAAADPANPAILQEYGFSDFSSGSYKRDDGRTLTLRAARFADASGAYGAFTYYKQPEMLNEKIGDQASSLNNRVLFYRGNVLIEAVFDKLSAMSAAELRELAADVPLPQGGARNLPSLPTYLPKQAYVKNTAKYVMGPLALNKIASPLPPELIDFSAGAEVIQGTYRAPSGDGTLILISYPTPQIAAEHLRRIEATRPTNGQPSASAPVVVMGTFAQKRSGPLVAVASGTFSQNDANSLVGSVHYEAGVTWNENTFFDKKNNIANLLWNVVLLCGALMGITLVAGLAFGGVRIALRRLLPERTRKIEEDFISLNLDQAGRERTSSPGISGSA
jgi:hypothetical protein